MTGDQVMPGDLVQPPYERDEVSYMVTFQEMSLALGLPRIRAVEVNHLRGILHFVTDRPVQNPAHPGATIRELPRE